MYRVDGNFGDDEDTREDAVGLFNSMTVLPYVVSKQRTAKTSYATAEGSSESEQMGLLVGLKPLRDKYLAYALSRMNAPVLQVQCRLHVILLHLADVS